MFARIEKIAVNNPEPGSSFRLSSEDSPTGAPNRFEIQ